MQAKKEENEERQIIKSTEKTAVNWPENIIKMEKKNYSVFKVLPSIFLFLGRAARQAGGGVL